MTTPDKQIDLLEGRVTRLEERTNAEITQIHSKLDSIVTLINSHLVQSAQNHCPKPGVCLTLEAELKTHVAATAASLSRIEKLELRMIALEKWQGKVLGGIALLMVLLALFGENIRNLFQIP